MFIRVFYIFLSTSRTSCSCSIISTIIHSQIYIQTGIVIKQAMFIISEYV